MTGRIAVLEGKTLIGEKPKSVPERLRAALAESVNIRTSEKTMFKRSDMHVEELKKKRGKQEKR